MITVTAEPATAPTHKLTIHLPAQLLAVLETDAREHYVGPALCAVWDLRVALLALDKSRLTRLALVGGYPLALDVPGQIYGRLVEVAQEHKLDVATLAGALVAWVYGPEGQGVAQEPPLVVEQGPSQAATEPKKPAPRPMPERDADKINGSILDVLRANPDGIAASAIAERTSLHVDTVLKHLKAMSNLGRVRRYGFTAATRWFLVGGPRPATESEAPAPAGTGDGVAVPAPAVWPMGGAGF